MKSSALTNSRSFVPSLLMTQRPLFRLNAIALPSSDKSTGERSLVSVRNVAFPFCHNQIFLLFIKTTRSEESDAGKVGVGRMGVDKEVMVNVKEGASDDCGVG